MTCWHIPSRPTQQYHCSQSTKSSTVVCVTDMDTIAAARRPAATSAATVVPGEAAASIDLAALPSTPFWARRHAQAVLGAWQIPPDTIETAVLLASELVTNAVAATVAMHGPAREPAMDCAGLIVQTLRLQPGRIVIEVSDCDPSPPVPTKAGPDAEAGRGLMLVQALSKEWSWCSHPEGGKTVYCVIRTD